MDCKEAQQNLVDLVYQPKSADLPQKFRDHFAACSECSREYMLILETRRELAEWPDEHAPTSLVFVSSNKPGRARAWIASLRQIRPVTAMALSFMVLLAFLAFANVRIQWEDGRFGFQSGILAINPTSPVSSGLYVGSSDVLGAVDRMLAASEERQIRQTVALLQRVADTMEYKRQADLFQVRDDMDLLQRNYYQVLERNSVLLEEAAKILQQNRY